MSEDRFDTVVLETNRYLESMSKNKEFEMTKISQPSVPQFTELSNEVMTQRTQQIM
jgi:hypothetical protein